VWLRRLSTDRIERRSSALADAPFVIVASIKSAQRITALNDAAARLGLRRGMPLADARAMYPGLAVQEADAEGAARLLEGVADWCDRYTPLVGLDKPDGLVLDITGCAHLFGGEAALCRDLVTRLTRQNFAVRVAVADTWGAAWGVARYKDFRPLAARFGKALIRRLDQAVGREDEPITPRLPIPAAMAEQRFPEPIAREEDVLGTIEHLARQLDGVLERRGEGARLIQLALFRADGKVHRLEIGTGAPLRDPARIRRLFEDRLAVLGDACDPGFGFDLVRVSALVSERSDPVQTGLAGPDHAEELAHLIDRLGARFGLRRVCRLVPQDTHIPEFAMAMVPAHAVRQPRAVQIIEQDSLGAVRPIRLFDRPEPIEATAEVPDGPPVRFRWRRVLHEVARVEGPERIAMEWWRDDRGNKLTRDYFRVESRDGIRLWLYRQGLFGSETGTPGWYVHGLFA
jgi:protein ImuB